MSLVTEFNEGQQQAIDTRNKNILVSAPAGSGKTKILVSRILSLLKEGVDIDQFLVLTFTQAAAQEMKQRLMGLLDEAIKDANGDLKDHLIKQKAKMPFSYITNFHGFCNALIDHYGYLIGIKTGYEILSDSEALMQEAMARTMEEALGDEAFCEMRSLYFSKREDLEAQLIKLYEVLQALGNREVFLSSMKEEVYGFLKNPCQRDLSEWCFYPWIQDALSDVVVETLAGLEELKQFCVEQGILYFYERPLSQTKNAASKAIPYEALKNYYTELLNRLRPGVPLMGAGGLNEWALQKPEAAYTISWKDLGEEIAAQKNVLSAKKTALNSNFKKAYEKLIERDEENMRLVYSEAYRVIDLMLDWTQNFEAHYRTLKSEANVLDFNDLERYATRLLQADLPVAKDLNLKLYEIMVDEYQDTNMVQENIVQLIAKATPKEVPCFMVGDMKQSIYRFRQADPEIFKQKYDGYPQTDGALRVDLVFNYRSSKVVLDSINYIFNQIMDTHFGSLEYYRDEKAQLNYDFLRKEKAKDTEEYDIVKQKAINRMALAKDDHTEILLVKKSDDKPNDMEDSEYEAAMIATRISQLVSQGLDGSPLAYSDIAVLMRQTTKFMVYKKVFDRYHIPTTIVLSRGFMEATEIRQMMMLYEALLDPNNDLALLSVLRAPFDFSYFQDEKIAQIRDKEHSLYENILACDDFQGFIEVFEDLRKQLFERSFASWHEYFFEVSGYLERVSKMKNGMQRYQNLLLLVEKIKEQQDKIHWIKDWVAYFQTLGSGADAPAVMPKDQQAVVFMTIHKSKGLEFPVVFVAMHDKKFNLQDGKDRLIFDRKLSMSIKPRQRRSFETTLFEKPAHFFDVALEYDNPFLALLSARQNKETISEEMRIYYVALTRAGKKLILTGVMDQETCLGYLDQAYNQTVCQMPERDEKNWIYNRQTRHAHSYLDWLMPSVFRHREVLNQLVENTDEIGTKAKKILEALPFDLAKSKENTSQSHFDLRWKSYQEILDKQVKKIIEKQDQTAFDSFELSTYAYQNTIDKPRSMAVTALEKQEINLAGQQSFQVDEGISANQRGTLVHDFMERIPMNLNVSVLQEMERLYQAGKYSPPEYEVLCAYASKLEAFRQSECFEMMRSAKTCLKEQPFCLEKDGMILHGIIDVLCINDKAVQLIDYKTDRVSLYAKNKDLIERHAVQLSIYKEALKKIYPDKLIEGYLYYLQTNRCVKV